MTASEFAFMALGLVLGVVTGAALLGVLRSRRPARREVLVTVAPNSIARRRAATLADVAPGNEAGEPARGGPADRRWLDGDKPDEDVAPDAPGREAGTPTGRVAGPRNGTNGRTPVPVVSGSPSRLAGTGTRSVGIPVAREPDPMMAAIRATTTTSDLGVVPSGNESSTSAPVLGASVATLPRPAAADVTSPGEPSDPSEAGMAANELTTGGRGPANRATGAPPLAEPPADRPVAEAPAEGSRAARADAIAGACDEPRRIADERCLVAARAREGAQAALESLRSAQDSYDEHASRAEVQAAVADPRAVRDAKEAAQQTFRAARAAGRTRDDVETAARDWLTEINRINLATREASALAERHRLAASELAANLERLSVEADAARISAESADEACVAAREAVAACQEAAAVLTAGGRRSPGATTRPGRPASEDDSPDEDVAMGSRAGEDAVIIRLLRGDREALARLVAQLGGGDAAERRRWQASIGALLEAFVARSIEASAFDFPAGHSFWGTFSKSQCRDIAAALSSLGYRHDGFGSFADDHVPTQRDLSLAVGYAGLDPMRIRHWPSEAEIRDLLRDVTVAADEYIWEAAGTLTLGELVSLLGRRADGLTELWNEWGVVRPLLLAVG